MDARLRACLLALAVGACGNSKAIEDLVQCGPVDASLTCPAVAPTFAQVQPIFERSCVPCHDGTMKDDMMQDVWPLTDYDDIVDWQGVIKSSILLCTMPPANGGIPITNAERSAIVQWVLCETPP